VKLSLSSETHWYQDWPFFIVKISVYDEYFLSLHRDSVTLSLPSKKKDYKTREIKFGIKFAFVITKGIDHLLIKK